jgi:hypothetical protein
MTHTQKTEPRYVVRVRGGHGQAYRVIDRETGESVRSSTTRQGAENQADAMNARLAR